MNIESIRYSLRNIRHSKERSFLTVFSILIGIMTIFIFISFGVGLYEYTNSFTTGSSADKVLVMSKGGTIGLDDTFKLTDDDLGEVESSGGVIEATGIYYGVVEVSKEDEKKYVFIASFDPKKMLLMELFQGELEKGRWLNSGEKGAILGYNYLKPDKIFEKALDLNDLIEVNGEKVKIIGFLKSVGNPSDDAQIYVVNDYYLDLLPNSTSYSQIIARANINEIDFVVENIERSLRKERDLEKGKEDFFVQSFEDMIESYSGALDIVVGFVILIALISVLVSSINTANTMITSVLERYKEIGILKAIGAKNSEIFNIFLFESSFLGFVAGVMGVILGFLLTSLGATILEIVGWSFLSPSYNIWIFVGCIAFATLTGSISGVLPALRASKINPVDALRYE